LHDSLSHHTSYAFLNEFTDGQSMIAGSFFSGPATRTGKKLLRCAVQDAVDVGVLHAQLVVHAEGMNVVGYGLLTFDVAMERFVASCCAIDQVKFKVLDRALDCFFAVTARSFVAS